MNEKLARWKARILLQVGQTTLIKSNLPDILIFTMYGIKIPTNISRKVDSIIRNFFLQSNLEPNRTTALLP